MDKISSDLDKWTMLFKKAVIADMMDTHNQIKHDYATKLTEIERDHIEKLNKVSNEFEGLKIVNDELQKKVDLKNEFLEKTAEIMCKSSYQKMKYKYFSIWRMNMQTNQVLKLKEQTTTSMYTRQLKRRVLDGWKGQIAHSKEKVFEKRVKQKHDKEIHDLRQLYETDIINV